MFSIFNGVLAIRLIVRGCFFPFFFSSFLIFQKEPSYQTVILEGYTTTDCPIIDPFYYTFSIRQDTVRWSNQSLPVHVHPFS